MRFIAAIAAAIVLLAVIGVVLAPQLVPASTYKPHVEEAASEALGRPVTIGDDISFTLIPRTAFKVSELRIANPEGFGEGAFATVENADVGVRLLPFIQGGAIEIDRFVLTRPALNFVKRADGNVNWNLAEGATNKEAPSGNSPPGAAPLKDLKLGDVRIVDGSATYTDETADQAFKASDMNLTARLASLSEPFELDGDMTFQGEPSTVSLVVTTLKDIMDGKEANLKLDTKIGATSAGADLALMSGEALSYKGKVNFDAPDLPAFAKLFGAALEEAPGFDRFAIEGAASGNDQGVQLSDAVIGFDAIDAKGNLGLAWSGAKPKATGALDVGALDLRPYLPPPSQSAGGFPEWSDDKIDFSSLRNMDADLSLTADAIYLNDLKTGASTLKLMIDNGRMVAEIPQMALYSGGGSGQLVVNARRATPSFSGVFDFNSVEAQSFTKDFMKIDKLLGLGGARMNFTASGASQKAIMNSLDGQGGFDLNDGAIKGINLVKIARAAASLGEQGLNNPATITQLIAEARRPDEQTDFSRFLSQFTIENGQMNAPTINLEGPFLTMRGSGLVNLPGQTVDLRLAPKATSTLDGEGGRSIAIPVRISGTFSEPKVSVDVEALLKGRVENIGRDLLNRAFGGGEQTSAADPDAAATEDDASTDDVVRDIANDALGRLFGGSRDEEEEESGGGN